MSSESIERDVLPIPDRQPVGLTTFDAKEPATSFPTIEPLRPPTGAPNVLIVLLDDVGFGASSAFGGPCRTPTAERLAAGGLKYRRFHTTAMCAPTRQALLTGRNHHSVGMGAVADIATSAPGYSSIRPNTAAPLAQVLKLNGYATAQFGKCHEVPLWQTSPMGPYDAWPSGGGGFEYFYGFLGGETNQYAPSLYEGTIPVEPDRTPEEGYHFTEDMTDRAVGWVRRQKELGVIPPEAELTARHEGIPAWEEMPEELLPVLARQMEVYAGYLEHTDYHVGRLIDTLERLEVLDDTLVFYIVGDNGASPEGLINGTFNEMLFMNGVGELETAEFMAARIEQFGTPAAYNHYAVGWSHAMDTPYQWTKQVASNWRGTRNGAIVHWPRGISSRGEVRDQFHHVIDVAPTVLEVAGLPQPTFVVGMAYSFDAGAAADRRQLQYFEMVGNRGVYHQGWTAVTKHATPWVAGGELPAFDDDVWELYAPEDWTQAAIWRRRCPGSCMSCSACS